MTSRSGPSARRGTGRMCMPKADKRANSTAQPGSSTITGSPGRSSVRLTMSSACVAPTVVMMFSGAACTFSVASFLDSTRRSPAPGAPRGNRVRGAPVAHGTLDFLGARVVVLSAPVQQPVGHLAHKKAPVLARLHQALRQQLVVRCNHSGRAHAMLLRALPHRRQARAGRQQPVADALAETRRQLLGQRLGGGFHQHGGVLVYCYRSQYRSRTALLNCTGCVLTSKITLKPRR